MQVLVTGANGFAGRPTCAELLRRGHSVVAAVRRLPEDGSRSAGPGAGPGTEDGGRMTEDGGLRTGDPPEGAAASRRCSPPLAGSVSSSVAVGDIGPSTDWTEALQGVAAVVHLAARVHQMDDRTANPLAEFRRVNVEGTRRLAEQAAAAGVKRFIFVSSIKVNGEATAPARAAPITPNQEPRTKNQEPALRAAFRETDTPNPQDPYGISKHEAELALREVERATGMAVTILRPPLMYGPGVKANFASLARAIAKGIPLPFGRITENRRSLLHVSNLADAIATCLERPEAAGETFLLSDGMPLSTAGLCRRIGAVVGRPARLLPVPVWSLCLLGKLTGKSAAIERLTGSLVIDDAKIHQKLGWAPKLGLRAGMDLRS
jgi:nucleoside-diphosphate-sugar epimerase